MGIIACIYLVLDVSNVSSISVNGNIYLKDEDVISLSELDTNKKYIFVNASNIENKIKTNELIDLCKVEKLDDRSIVINVSEKKAIGYGQLEGNNVLFLADGSTIALTKNNLYLIGRVPLIEGFTNNNLILIEKNLSNVDEKIINEISEIHYYPSLKFQDHEIIMRDGNYIFTSVYGLDILNKYHSMASIFSGDEKRCYYIEDISGNAYTSSCPWETTQEDNVESTKQENE